MNGKQYRNIRKNRLGFKTREALAGVLGVSTRTIMRRENDESPITNESQLALAALSLGLKGYPEEGKE